MDTRLPSQPQVGLQGFRKVVRAGANGHVRAASHGGRVSLSHPAGEPDRSGKTFTAKIGQRGNAGPAKLHAHPLRSTHGTALSTSERGHHVLNAFALRSPRSGVPISPFAVGVPIPLGRRCPSTSGGCPYLSGARPSNSGLRNHSTGNRPVISSIAACDLGYWPLSSVSWIQPASASRISSSTAL